MSAPLSSLERKIQPVSVACVQCHVQMSIGYRKLNVLWDARTTEINVSIETVSLLAYVGFRYKELFSHLILHC
jgi:hypothetical protein